jgi:serine phosphatase RsbU (regulator of sigma subunit)
MRESSTASSGSRRHDGDQRERPMNRWSTLFLNTSWRPFLVSAGAAFGLYVAAGTVEAGLIRVLQPSELELAWVSDVVLAAASGVAVFLWLHLRATSAELAARQREKLVVDTQLAIAADIQRRLLPELPAGTADISWAAALRPAGVIGGDFYDVVSRGPGRWFVLVADVSGKGIPAAMALGSLRATFRALSTDVAGPGTLLGQMSDALYDQWGGSPYLTAIIVEVDLDANRLTYSNAGHPDGLLAGRAGLRRLESLGPPAGLLPGIQYPEVTLAVEETETCVLVTDGVTEALGSGEGSVLASLIGQPGTRLAPPQAACDEIMGHALQSNGPAGVDEWHDDRTVLVFALRPTCRPARPPRDGLPAVHGSRSSAA